MTPTKSGDRQAAAAINAIAGEVAHRLEVRRATAHLDEIVKSLVKATKRPELEVRSALAAGERSGEWRSLTAHLPKVRASTSALPNRPRPGRDLPWWAL